MARIKKIVEKKTVKKKAATSKIAKPTDAVEVVKLAAEELLAKLEIEATIEVELVDEVYQVKMETEESGLLIGFHGETLSSFQLILGLIVYKKLRQWVRVVVEVGDYRARREEQLRAMAQSYASQVVASGQPLVLPSLPPIERRIIHMALSDNPEVVTVSEGEGNQRRVVIKLK